MAEVVFAQAWDFEVERGPDCLIVQPRQRAAGRHDLASANWVAADRSKMPTLGEQIWALLEQNFSYRLVLELGQIDTVDAALVEQLAWLEKQIHARDGMMRICGLSSQNEEALHMCQIGCHFTAYRDRTEAIIGAARPTQPR